MMPPDNDLRIALRHGAGQPLDKVAHNWGMILADIVRHIGLCYHQTDGIDPELVRARVVEKMQEDLELLDPEMRIQFRTRRLDEPGG